MRKIIEFSVHHSLFVNLLSVFVFAAGVLSIFALRRDAFPNISYDVVMVQSNYFGSPPEEIEKLITIEIEDKLKEVNGIDEMTSISSENISLFSSGSHYRHHEVEVERMSFLKRSQRAGRFSRTSSATA